MKRQLQGIALILVSILLMLGYGNVAFFDLSFKWAFPLMPLVLMPVFTFLLMSFAYHSDMILIKGANSNVSGFSLSMPFVVLQAFARFA